MALSDCARMSIFNLNSVMRLCQRLALVAIVTGATAHLGITKAFADGPANATLVASLNENEVLSHGRKLEIEGRWHEAILYYEKITKKNPSFKNVVERLQVCRVHYDVTRRYSDRSFLNVVDTSTPSRSFAGL